LNNRTLLSLLLVVGFVGTTSCGDDQSKKDAEIMALSQQLAQQRAANAANGVGTPVVIYSTQTNTSVVSSTVTSVTGSTTSYSTGTYTVTGTVGSTRTNTSSSSSTSTAVRE